MTIQTVINDIFSPLAEWLGVSTSFVVYLLLAGLLISMVCITLWLSHKKTQLLKQKLERLQHDFRVSNNSAIGMGQKIMALEKQLKKTGAPQSFSHLMSDQTIQKERAFHSDTDSKYKPSSQANNDKNIPVSKQTKSTAQLSVVSTNFSLDDLNNVESDEAEQDVAYELSKQLLDQGYSVEDIMSKSGLSYSEVSLMKSLSKR